MRDTSPEAAAVLRTVIAGQSPSERMAHAIRLSEDVRNVALAALRRRFPEESTLQLVERLTGEPLRAGVRAGPTR